MIAVTVDVGRLPQQLRNCAKAIRSEWWREFSSQAMSLLEREQARHFATQSGPLGERWPGLSELSLALSAGQASRAVGGATSFRRTKAGGWRAKGPGGEGLQKSAVVRRTAGSRVMSNTGLLRASVTSGAGKGAVRRRAAHYLDFGTRLPYAKRLHFGGTWPVTARQRGYLSYLLGEWFLGKSITTPARPFLGVSPRCKAELMRAAVAVGNRLLAQAARH